MKYLVEWFPEKEQFCINSFKHFLPPIFEEPYEYLCKIDNRICDLCKGECRYMIDYKIVLNKVLNNEKEVF